MSSLKTVRAEGGCFGRVVGVVSEEEMPAQSRGGASPVETREEGALWGWAFCRLCSLPQPRVPGTEYVLTKHSDEWGQ